ncbi:VCBS domain-containing protein [Vibrio brasiliensis]|uniref:VCBS domain-containing protein n=1 Tax=Vibrio brasiliensis TaxID=170652 RepID=UPI001EFE492F|nr:VCBS domain-containing protein [Vibrio brasiliensis]MCG9751987.1 VCBS domain-containing protein [Vibrio brasiliensis]
MANKNNVKINNKNTQIKNKQSDERKQKKLRLHSHLKVNIPLFQSLMMILPSLAKHVDASEGSDDLSDEKELATTSRITNKNIVDHHAKTASLEAAHQSNTTNENHASAHSDVNQALHETSTHLVPSHHLSTLSHPQVHYIPSVSIPTISAGSNGQPTHSNTPPKPTSPVTFIPEIIKGTYGELHVDVNGQYTFVLNPKSPQYILLNQHQQGTDHFVLHLSNGSSIIVQIPVTGQQDTPSISGDLTGVVTEDHNIDSQGLLHANGKIDVIDPDQGESSVKPDVIPGNYGVLTIDADGHWQYQVNNSLSNVQALTGATSLHESFTIYTKDGTPQTIEMTIGGNDDNAVITGVDVGSVIEDLTTQVQGQLAVTDPDLGEDHFQASQVKGHLGTLTITKDGAWTYVLDNTNPTVQALGKGSTATDTITVHSADGTSHQVTISINGTNDKALIGGTSSGAVTEETQRKTTGTLTIADVDTGEAHFSNTDVAGALGTLHLKDSGAWSYDLDNTNSKVQALGKGATATDTITVHSADGTPYHITVTINGTNDKAVIGGTSSGAVTEESQLQTSGTLTITDVDTGEAHFSNADVAGSLGTLHMTDSGQWTYHLDNTNPTVQALGKGSTATDTIAVHSADGTPHQITVTINGTNDRPTISGTSSGAIIEQGLNTAGTPDATGSLTATDLDKSDTITWAINQPQGQWGTLSIDPHGHWHYQLDNSTGSAADKLAAGEHQTESFWITATDSAGATVPHKVVIDVQGSNDKPIVSSWTQLPAGIEDQPVTIKASDLLTHASDVDSSDVLHVTNLQATHGSLTDNKDGTYTFTPDKDFNGEIRLTYDVVDGHGGSVSTQAKFDLTAAPDNAMITDAQTNADLRGVTEDRGYIDTHYQLHYDGKLNIQDPDAGEAQFDPNIGPQTYQGIGYDTKLGGHILLMRDGHYTYTLDNRNIQNLAQGEVKHDSAVIRSADGTTHTIELTVHGTNDAPTINAQSHSVTEGGSVLNGQMVGHDIDTGATLTYSIANPVDGLTFNVDGSYSFDPSNASYNHLPQGKSHTLTIPVTVTDEHGATSTQNLEIVVTGTNDAAKVSGVDTGSVHENQAGQDMSPDYAQPGMSKISHDGLMTSGQLSIIDPDSGEAGFDTKGGLYSYHGQYGHLLLREDGHWDYKVAAGQTDWLRQGASTTVGTTIDKLGAGETLTDTITIQTKDGTSHDIIITIHGDNDAPYVSGEVQLNSGKEDLPQIITQAELLANSIDVDHNDIGQLNVANLYANHGSILDNKDGTYTFTPDRDYNGKVHFTYDVKDAHGGTTHTGASTTLVATPDKAIISEVTTGSVIEDGPHATHNNGTTTELANGQLQVIDPDSGEDKFQYSQFGETRLHDPFGGMLRIDSAGNWGYSVDNAALQHLAQGQVETVTYRVHSFDGTAYDLNIDVVGTNDTPTVTKVVLSNGTEDTHYQMQASQFGFTDVDTGDTLHSIAITDLPPATQGKFVLDGHDITAGQSITAADITKLQFVPTPNFNGDVQFKFTVNDGHVDSQEATNTLHIDAISDAAQFTGRDTGDVHEGHTYTAPDGSMSGGYVDDRSPDHMHGNIGKIWNDEIHTDGHMNIVDPDSGENHAQTGTYQGTHGHVILQSNGDWSYYASIGQDATGRKIDHLGQGESITDTVTIKSADGTTHDIHITIHGDNDRPYCSSEVQLNSGKEDLAQTITTTELLANTVDVDTNDAGHLSIANLHADHGTLVDNKDGTFTFTPDHNFNGKVHFTYDVKDAHGGVTHTGASTTLLPSNDAATLQPTLASNFVTEDHLKSGTSTNELWSGWKNLDIQDIDSPSEAKVTQIEVNGVKHTVPANFAMNLAGVHGTFNFTHSTDGHDKWSYSADNSHVEVQSLSHGDSLTDTITLITADGTRIPLTAKILGTDDHVIIDTPDALTAALGTAVEDKVTSISGTLLAHDSDSKDSVTFSAGDSTGAYGTLHVDSNGQWHYDLDHSKANALQQGETKAEGFDITAISTDGSTATKHIEVLVQGKDDGAIISGQDSGQVTEDKHLQASGNLTVIDPDSGEGHFTATSGSTQLGTYTIDASGHWTYSLDPRVQSLHQGETTPDVFTVHSADGTAHVIKVTITGTQDAPIITGQSTGAVYEDSQTSVSGTLHADDKDYGQSGFWAQSHIASTHNLGDLSIDQNGYWTFHLDSTNPAVNSLGEHDTLQETVTVNTIDGTSKVIQITIHGTNDDPVLSVTQTTPTTGTLTETDVDVNDTHTFSVVNSTGQFGSLSVDPDSGAYVYTANGSLAGMSYNAATHTYHGTDVFEVKVADNHGGESSTFITFDANGHVSVVPGQSPTISTSVPSNPLVTTTQPSLPAGTNTPPNNAVTVDLAASSDTGISDTDNLTKDSTPTITGHTDIPYSQVTIYDGSTPIGHAVSDGSGQYSVAVSSLSNGDHNLSAKALAPSSVLPATSSILSLHVDTGVTPLHVSLTHDTGSNSSDLITSDGSLTISGQEAGATVEYSTDNGHTWASSFTPQQGSNTVSVRQTDAAGNVSTETSVSFTLDNTVNAPTVSLRNDTGRHSFNTPDLITADSRLSIQTEAGAKVEYSNDGGHTWTAVFNPVEGVNDLQVRQTDIAGNVSPATHFSFTLDTTPGTVTVNPISQDNALNAAENNQPLVITGTTSNIAPGDVVYVVVGNNHFYDAIVKSDGTWSLTLNASEHQRIMATDRDYPIQVGTVDTAGNSTPRISTHLLIDTQSPIPHIAVDSVTQDNVLNAIESGQTIAITGTVTGDYHTGDIVSLKINGATISSLTGSVDASGHFSIPVAGSVLEHANIHTSYANGQSGSIHSVEATIITTDAAGNVGSATTGSQVFGVDTHVSLPTITFENPGPDGLYSKAEIAHGHPNTVTATITPPGDAKVGEHLVVNGQDHVLDAHTLQHGLQIEVSPGSQVQVTMTDEHGNTAGSQGVAASAIPEPIVVKPPSGSHQVSGTLGVPPLVPSQTPVPSAQNGWRIHLPNGQYVTSHHGQYGTLTIDPQTGHLHYQEQAQVHTGPHGSASGIGQHEDKFEIALQGTNQDEVVAHVNVQILSHGPGHSGKLTIGTEVVDMTITPIVHASHPAPPPPPQVQHDEPEVASHEDFTFTVSDDTSLDLSQHTHQESDQKTDHHGVAAYLDALDIQQNASPTSGHDQPADMDIVLAQVDQQHALDYSQAQLDMSDALEHHDATDNHNQDGDHHHHSDVDGLPDIDPNN